MRLSFLNNRPRQKSHRTCLKHVSQKILDETKGHLIMQIPPPSKKSTNRGNWRKSGSRELKTILSSKVTKKVKGHKKGIVHEKKTSFSFLRNRLKESSSKDVIVERRKLAGRLR